MSSGEHNTIAAVRGRDDIKLSNCELSGGQLKPTITCKLPGCNNQLRNSYEHRVRFCKAHIRCPQFLYQELPSRFCQKCGRVQPLADFDGLKKSCRDSLKKHNEKQRALRSQRASYWAQLSKSADYADSFADGGVASNSCTHSEESELAVATPTTTLSLSWLENSLEVGPQAPRVAALSATPPLGPPRHQTGPLPAKISKPPSNNSVVDEHERTLPEPMSFDEFVNELLSEVYCLRQTDSGALPPAVQLPYLI